MQQWPEMEEETVKPYPPDRTEIEFAPHNMANLIPYS
jgi:hypothetical protein